MIGIFEDYMTQDEHRELRKVMGMGIAITRGSAAALSFGYSLLLLTICKNVITKLRNTILNSYIPFDAAITFHKIVAVTSMLFACKIQLIFETKIKQESLTLNKEEYDTFQIIYIRYILNIIY